MGNVTDNQAKIADSQNDGEEAASTQHKDQALEEQGLNEPSTNDQVRVKAAQGRPASAVPLIKRTVEIPDDLWSWTRQQPEGAASLIRGLLEKERLARMRQDGNRTLTVSTRGGMMEAIAIEDGIMVLLEETLVLHYVHDVGRGFPVLHIPTRVEAYEVKRARAHERYEARLQAAAGPAPEPENTCTLAEGGTQ